MLRGTEAFEAEEEETLETLETKNSTKMNGTNGGNGKNGASSDVKYPANCAMRLSSTPGSDGDNNELIMIPMNQTKTKKLSEF